MCAVRILKLDERLRLCNGMGDSEALSCALWGIEAARMCSIVCLVKQLHITLFTTQATSLLAVCRVPDQ